MCDDVIRLQSTLSRKLQLQQLLAAIQNACLVFHCAPLVSTTGQEQSPNVPASGKPLSSHTYILIAITQTFLYIYNKSENSIKCQDYVTDFMS